MRVYRLEAPKNNRGTNGLRPDRYGAFCQEFIPFSLYNRVPPPYKDFPEMIIEDKHFFAFPTMALIVLYASEIDVSVVVAEYEVEEIVIKTNEQVVFEQGKAVFVSERPIGECLCS